MEAARSVGHAIGRRESGRKKTRRFEADATGSEESRESRQRTDHIIGDDRADAPFVSGEINVWADAPISTVYTGWKAPFV